MGRRPSKEELTPEMYKAISLLVYSDLNKEEISKEVGINPVTLWRWYKREEFLNELNKERKNKFSVYCDIAQKELGKLITDDSDKRTQLQAIKMVLQENNYCSDKKDITQNTTDTIIISLDEED